MLKTLASKSSEAVGETYEGTDEVDNKKIN